MIENLNGTHETVNYRENTNLRIYDNVQYEDYPTHWHSPIEIIMPIRNTYKLEYSDIPVTLREGDIIILCPGVLHHLYPAEGQRYIIQAEINPALNLREIDSILTIIQPALLITPERFPDSYEQIRTIVNQIMKEYKEAMSGIYTTSVNKGTLDESPMAYKSMEDIVENIGPTAEIVKVIRPVYNFKAAE